MPARTIAALGNAKFTLSPAHLFSISSRQHAKVSEPAITSNTNYMSSRKAASGLSAEAECWIWRRHSQVQAWAQADAYGRPELDAGDPSLAASTQKWSGHEYVAQAEWDDSEAEIWLVVAANADREQAAGDAEKCPYGGQ